jgi:hypothetical protein
MHAFLFSDIKEINDKTQKLGITSFDQIFCQFEGSSIGISDIRFWSKSLYLSPRQSPYIAGIISNADLLTVDAQNALLKLLEEPPPKALIMLQTNLPELLLPTVLSRLSSEKRNPKQELDIYSESGLKTVIELIRQKIGDRLKTLDLLIKSKADALTLIDTWMNDLILELNNQNTQFLNNRIPDTKAIKLTRKLFTARRQIMANVNPKLALDNVFLWS